MLSFLFRSRANQQSSAKQQALRRNTVRAAFTEVRALSGVPSSWLSVEVTPVPTAADTPRMHVRFLLHRWEPLFVQSAPRFETLLLLKLEAVDPQARQWLHAFSWSFENTAAFDIPSLPTASTWQTLDSDPAETCPAGWLQTMQIDSVQTQLDLTESTRLDLSQLQAARLDDQRRHGSH